MATLKSKKNMIWNYMARRHRSALAFKAIDLACDLIPKTSPSRTEGIESILISQAGHLGDLIMTIPTLKWLREKRPDIRIGLLLGSWTKPMLPSIREYFDEVYFADHYLLNRGKNSSFGKFTTHIQSWRDTANQLRASAFDAAIDVFPFFPNNIPLLRLAGVPVRVGFTSGSWAPLLTHGVKWVDSTRHYNDFPRDLLRQIFSDPSLASPFVSYYPEDASLLRPVQGEYVVIHAGTGNDAREWDEQGWRALIERLESIHERVVLAGSGMREAQRAARLSAANPKVINLTDSLSWNEFVGLVANAKHTFCLESASAHLSSSLGRPTTTIMPGINRPEQLGPSGPNSTALTKRTPCAPCYRAAGCDEMSCIRGVTADDVFTSYLMTSKYLDQHRE